MNLNNLTIAGNLTGPPELKFLQSGKAVCNFRLANNFKSKDTQKTTFIDCVCWERTAEVAGEFLVKGSPVLLEGRLDQEEWTDKTTQAKRSKHVLIVSRLHLFPATRPAELQGADAAGGSGQSGAGSDQAAGGPEANPFG
jgi:single-strand DNA-binding protein